MIYSQIFPLFDFGTRLVLAFPTLGCRWARRGNACIHCPVPQILSRHKPCQNLIKALTSEVSKYLNENIRRVYLYSPGSVLDTQEVEQNELIEIINIVKNAFHPEEIIIESRPELIKSSMIKTLVVSAQGTRIEVNIPLETSNDIVRNKIGKDFKLDLFSNKISVIQESGAIFSTCVLLKPPGLTERDAVYDAIESIKWVFKYNPIRILIEPMHVFRQTPLEDLYNKGVYRPPWIWSILAIVNATIKYPIEVGGEFIYPRPIGYPINCNKCSEKVYTSARKKAFYKDSMLKIGISECSCLDHWEKEVGESISKFIKQ